MALRKGAALWLRGRFSIELWGLDGDEDGCNRPRHHLGLAGRALGVKFGQPGPWPYLIGITGLESMCARLSDAGKQREDGQRLEPHGTGIAKD